MAATGILKRHSRKCRSTTGGGACSCDPSFQASAYDRRTGKRLRRHFASEKAAKEWRADVQQALRRGTLATQTSATLREAADAWLDDAKAGIVRNRSGEVFKPSALRGYEAALTARVLPDLGAHKLAEIRRVDLQRLADRLVAEGLDASTVRNVLMPVRAIYRRALRDEAVMVNPCAGLDLPASRGRRDRICSAAEAAALLDALPEGDRALWATAFYGGLRLGELRALLWSAVDLAAGVIRVERSWDAKEGPVEPKSRAGRREVPIVAALRALLLRHAMASGRREGLVFGRTADRPFNPTSIYNRAETAWRKAELTGSGLHEARHTFASILIAAGVNVKAVSSYMGHSSITITLDRYGHLMPGHETEAVERVDAYLAAATAPQTATQGL